MKNLLFVFALLLSNANLLIGQEHYLPISSKNKDATATYYRALTLGENAHIQDYTVEMNKAIEADPALFAGHAHLAISNVAFGNNEVAKASVVRALAVPAQNLTPAEKILRKLMVRWDTDLTYNPTEIMNELIATYPNTWQAHELAANSAQWITEERDSSIPHLQNMIRLRPNHGSAYNTLGYHYMRTKDMKQSKKAFKKYLRVAPKEANAYDSMGEYYLTVEDYKKSAKFYDKAASMGMESSKAQADKARSMFIK